MLPSQRILTSPLTLLYCLLMLPLSLRRYARSIHPELDEDLQVWKVRHEVGHDPRFQALCRARSILLLTVPFVGLLLVGMFVGAWSSPFETSLAMLGWVITSLFSDGLLWYFPHYKSAWHWRGMFLLLIVGAGMLEFGVISTFFASTMLEDWLFLVISVFMAFYINIFVNFFGGTSGVIVWGALWGGTWHNHDYWVASFFGCGSGDVNMCFSGSVVSLSAIRLQRRGSGSCNRCITTKSSSCHSLA